MLNSFPYIIIRMAVSADGKCVSEFFFNFLARPAFLENGWPGQAAPI